VTSPGSLRRKRWALRPKKDAFNRGGPQAPIEVPNELTSVESPEVKASSWGASNSAARSNGERPETFKVGRAEALGESNVKAGESGAKRQQPFCPE
jgi:hypothetical protein